jgi:MFS superfamily sulfate permease-like transporter
MPHHKKFLPVSVIALRHYSVQTLTADLIGGLTVGLVALPLAMAFAISSGVPPQAGIYTAVVTGFLVGKDFLGFTLDAPAPGEFIERMRVLGSHLGALSAPVAILGISVVFLIVIWNRLVPRFPWYIIALAGGTLAGCYSTFRSTRSAAGSAGSQRGCRPSRYLISGPGSRCSCFRPH